MFSPIYTCPKIEYKKQERINFIVQNILAFLTNDKLISLIKKSDRSFFDDATIDFVLRTKLILGRKKQKFRVGFFYKNSIIKFINKICDFSAVWDYRNKQDVLLKTGERARWLLEDDEFAKNNEEEIIECAKELGFIGKTELSNEKTNIDYVLVLGGGKESNILRPLYSKMMIDKYAFNDAMVVGLTCDRKIDESENTEKYSYDQSCKTEFDCVRFGLQKAFNRTKYIKAYEDIDKIIDEDITGDMPETGNKVYVLRSPANDGRERANSKDTYEYFFEVLFNQNLKNILLVSSQLFVPYQGLSFMEFAIDKNIYFEIVGYPYILYDSTGNYKHAQAVKYLQEFRSVMLTAKAFIDKYL